MVCKPLAPTLLQMIFFWETWPKLQLQKRRLTTLKKTEKVAQATEIKYIYEYTYYYYYNYLCVPSVL